MDIDKHEVVTFFQDTHQKFAEIRELLNSDEIDLASVKYSELKSSLERLHGILSKGGSRLNHYQANFLLPALSEIISSSLNARRGTNNKVAIGYSVADGDDYVRYWLCELGV